MCAGVTILVADDSDTQRYSYCRTLASAGFSTIDARCGTEALLKAREHPSLILLDMRLPDITGLEVCRRLKADPETSQIPIVFISASEQSGWAVNNAMQLGASGYLFSPVSSEQLLAVVNGSILRAGTPQDSL